jgi:AmiR/NasT family two-component response regulator
MPGHRTPTGKTPAGETLSVATQERKARPKPFQNSLSALAQVAMREAGADGYAFFRSHPASFDLAPQDASGVNITQDAVMDGAAGVTVYRLGTDGILAFAFQAEADVVRAKPQLDKIAASIESVWSAAQAAARYSDLASQVADLEARLLDSKIADRVRGFLVHRDEASPIEAITRHVEGVLRPESTGQVLEKLSRELEDEVEERRLTNRAKAILRSVHGMTEEEAHAHLRLTSRKTRRKLKEVAVELIDNSAAIGRNNPGKQHS